jgi:hypothetical protein
MKKKKKLKDRNPFSLPAKKRKSSIIKSKKDKKKIIDDES